MSRPSISCNTSLQVAANSSKVSDIPQYVFYRLDSDSYEVAIRSIDAKCLAKDRLKEKSPSPTVSIEQPEEYSPNIFVPFEKEEEDGGDDVVDVEFG